MDGHSGGRTEPGGGEQWRAGRRLARYGKAGMTGSAAVAGVGLLVLAVGLLMIQVFGSSTTGMDAIVTWPLMLVAVLLMALGGIALAYGVFGLILSRAGVALGRALERDRAGATPLAMGAAGLVALAAAAGVVRSLAEGSVPVVAAIVLVAAVRFLLSLRTRAVADAAPAEDAP